MDLDSLKRGLRITASYFNYMGPNDMPPFAHESPAIGFGASGLVSRQACKEKTRPSVAASGGSISVN